MKKVINITVGGVIFLIEEDAYESLNNYLGAIRKHFSKDKSGEEILDDIECSVADKFSKKNGTAISQENVEEVIAQMGKIEDFTGDDSQKNDNQSSESEQKRKLYRNPEDKIIGGVCSGIAAYFDIDSTIVRLALLVSLFFGGIGLVAYIVLWIAMPEAKTLTQQLEMRGEGTTLKDIENSVKNQVQKLKNSDWHAAGKGLSRKLSRLFHSSGDLLSNLLRILVIIFAVSLIVTSIAGLLAFSFGFSWVTFGTGISFSDLYLPGLGSIFNQFSVLPIVGMLIGIIIPLISILLLGISIIKKRLIGGIALYIGLLIFWTITLGFIFASFTGGALQFF